MHRARAHQRVPGTMRAELVGVEVGHGPVPHLTHPHSSDRPGKLGSEVRAHPAHKPTKAHKPLQPHHREEAPCCTTPV